MILYMILSIIFQKLSNVMMLIGCSSFSGQNAKRMSSGIQILSSNPIYVTYELLGVLWGRALSPIAPIVEIAENKTQDLILLLAELQFK